MAIDDYDDEWISEWNYESALILSAFENRPRAGLVQHTMQTKPAVKQNKKLNGPRVRCISPVGKERSII